MYARDKTIQKCMDNTVISPALLTVQTGVGRRTAGALSVRMVTKAMIVTRHVLPPVLHVKN